MDEDVRNRRIGILCLEKSLTPALTQALFRVKESAFAFHQKRIESKEKGGIRNLEFSSVQKQLREIKWSSLNAMRSFVAQEFLDQFFYYMGKGPLPVLFFNVPFKKSHLDSITAFFKTVESLNLKVLQELKNTKSVFFLDSFTTPAGYKFEEKVRKANNLLRCYRIDSRAHDIMQLTDLLLGVTTFLKKGLSQTSYAKEQVVQRFSNLKKGYDKKAPKQGILILDS